MALLQNVKEPDLETSILWVFRQISEKLQDVKRVANEQSLIRPTRSWGKGKVKGER